MPHSKPEKNATLEQGELPLFFGEQSTSVSFQAPPTPVPPLRRIFLGWDRSVLDLSVDYLSSDWNRKDLLDLSDRLVILPTQHSGRRLREGLAIYSGNFDGAVIPPLTATPDFLISPDRLANQAANAAGRGEALLIWIQELLTLPLERYRGLFPIDPVERHFHWALKTAAELLRVRDLSGEAGLDFQQVYEKLAERGMEPERWRDLAKLERRVFEKMDRAGLSDREMIRRQAAAEGGLPPGIKKISIIATPDPSPLALDALNRLSRLYPVEVAVFAPESHANDFDRWGRPLASRWIDRHIDISEPETRIHPCATAAQQARKAATLIASHENPAGAAAIGLPDPELAVPLSEALAKHKLRPFDPAGETVSSHGLFYLLRLWHQLLTTRGWKTVADLLRCPDFANAACEAADTGGEETSPLRQSRLLSLADEFQGKALPDTIDDGIELCHDPQLRTSLDWISNWVRKFESAPFEECLTGFLGAVFSTRHFRNHDPGDAVYIALADQIHQHLDALSPSLAKHLSSANQLALLLHLMENQAIYPERAPEDIDLQGWLELLWEDAPHLIITGMNDGLVPEAIIGHAWLPDSARQVLGIRHNETRMARDAYLLTAAIASRTRPGGRLDLIFGRTALSGDPLRPSRLLFQCPDEELPARTLRFFEEPPAESVPTARDLAWRLSPAPLPDDSPVFFRISVTAFRSYLACPFRFYLRYGLGMNEVDYQKSEMDPRDFGIAIHDVLEQFYRRSGLHDSEDENEIREYFLKRLDAKLYSHYGPRLSVPVMIQRESARQRLSWWAAHEAEERRDGWRILGAEEKISSSDEPWTIADMEVRGTIDRIERHPEHGIRLLDFKTMTPVIGGSRKSVDQFHLAPLKRTESPGNFPDWALHQSGEKPSRWVDLQLPLYHLAAARQYPGETIRTGYVTLGRAKSDIAVDLWDSLDEAALESALGCAQGVIGAIRDRVFWPPAEKTPYTDAYGPLFFGDPEAAVDPTLLNAGPDPVE